MIGTDFADPFHDIVLERRAEPAATDRGNSAQKDRGHTFVANSGLANRRASPHNHYRGPRNRVTWMPFRPVFVNAVVAAKAAKCLRQERI